MKSANNNLIRHLFRWLISEPPEDSMFFTHIRNVGHMFHVACGHQWLIASDKTAVRTCMAYGEEQWLMRSRFTGELTWRKVDRPS